MNENHDQTAERSTPANDPPATSEQEYLAIVLAEVAPPTDFKATAPAVKVPPRIWSALVVGILTLPLAVVVSTVVFLLVMAVSIDVSMVRDPVRLEAWITSFTASRAGLVVLSLPGQMVFFGVACLAARFSPMPFLDRLRLRKGTMPYWSWPIYALATPAIGTLTFLLMSLFFTELGEHLEMLENVFRGHRGPFILVVILLVAVIPGVSEELLFRGYVQSRLLQRMPARVAISISSLLFAVAHLDPMHVLAVIPLGFWMGVVAWRANSILPAICCHVVNNALSILMTHYSEPSGFELDANPVTLGIIAISGVALIASIPILAMRGRTQESAEAVIETEGPYSTVNK